MSDFIIAIDGGGTSCRAAVADRQGRILGRGKQGSANIFTGSQTIAASIAGAAEEALVAAGLEAGSLVRIPALLGLAGLNVGTRQVEVAKMLPFRETRFVHDGIIALQGALGDADGVIAIFGTGSAYAVRQHGQARIVGGWGFAAGDQASGAVLGRALLQQTLLAHDGIRPHTPLSQSVMERFDGDPEAVVEFAQASKPSAYGALAPMIFEFDAKNDLLAQSLLAEAMSDINEALDAIVFEGCERLCLLGGLSGQYSDRLAPRHKTILREPLGDALSGAVQLALRAFREPDGKAAAL